MPFTKFYCSDEILEDEIGRVCGTYRGESKCMYSFGEET